MAHAVGLDVAGRAARNRKLKRKEPAAGRRMAAGFTSKTARRSCAGSWCRVSTGRRKTADTGACSDPRASPTIRPSDACADCRMRTRIPIADRSGAAPPTLPRQQCFTPSLWKTGVATLINSARLCSCRFLGFPRGSTDTEERRQVDYPRSRRQRCHRCDDG